MQYKIPVQIENEDPIIIGLSLRQLIIIMVWSGLGYSIFTSLSPILGTEIAAIPSLIIASIAFLIAIFKYSEMTFIPFILSFIRYKVNLNTRKWIKGVDSFSALDVGFVSNMENKKTEKIDFWDKISKIREMEEKLKKI